MSILEQFKENFNRHPLIIRILYVLLVIAFFYDIFTGKAFSIYFSVTLILLIISEVVYWFFYKKE